MITNNNRNKVYTLDFEAKDQNDYPIHIPSQVGNPNDPQNEENKVSQEPYDSETHRIKKGESSKGLKDNEEKNEDEPHVKTVHEIEAENDLKNKYPSVSFFKLQFTLSGAVENTYFILGIIGAIGMGIAFPIFSLVFGDTMDEFGDDVDTEVFLSNIEDLAKKIIYVGLGMLVASTMNILFSLLAGELTQKNIRHDYFKSLLRQEQGFYDSRNSFEFATKVQSQVKQIGMGIGMKIGNLVMSLVMFVGAYVVGFIVCWKLSLVLCSVVPFIVFFANCMINQLANSQTQSRTRFEEAGGIAEEVLYNIKTVASFSNFGFEKDRFGEKVEESYEKGKYGGMMSSIGKAFLMFFIFGSYALAVGVGAKFISDGVKIGDDLVSVGDIVTVIFTIIFGSFSLGQAAPNLKAISTACDSAREYFFIKERIPEIDTSKSIDKPDPNSIKGHVEFKDISFAYPSKLDRKILKNLTLEFEKGKKTAIVGQTGSGKSTIINLVERLYDPQEGNVYIDGKDIREFDIDYFRSFIGYVPQEPVLFNNSLRDNIIFGRKDVTDEEIKLACEKAYLNDFIDRLDKGLDTRVGLRGSKLSGGQKQRVAIARAILKAPKILILDEATSALDYRSEKIVKKALDNISHDVTTIVIAHRLSTIINSDKIVVLDQGEIKEVGTHDELFAKNGLYYLLVKNQQSFDSKKENEGVNENDKEEIKADDDALNNSEGVIEQRRQSEILKRVSSKISEKSRHSNKSKQEEKKSAEEIAIKEELIQRKLEIRRKKALLEDDSLTLEQRKKILDEQEALKDKQLNEAKKLLWPIMAENPSVLATATFMACLHGCVWPIYGLLLAEMVIKLSQSDLDLVLDDGKKLAGYFVAIAVVAGIANFGVGHYFSVLGEHLARRMRMKCYDKYLQLHMGFYDFSENSPGALLTRLSSDTVKINGIALSMFSVIFETVVTLILGITLGFVYCWQLALICCAFVPFIIVAASIGAKMQMGYAKNDEIKDKDLGNMLSETVTNTKTIYCFNMQEKISDMYHEKINEGGIPYTTYAIAAFISGISQFLIYAVFAITFWVGAKLVNDKDIQLPMDKMLKSIFCLINAAFGVGTVAQYLGDMDEARKSLISLFDILTTESEIDPYDKENKVEAKVESFVSKIEFKNVSFRYPSRPDTEIFKNLSFIINSGEHCAFVGFSGSGKSTIIQLILRFYDPDDGDIFINEVNVKDYDLVSLRKMMGIVMQEPVLFKINVYNNIKYGNLDVENPTERIIDSAKRSLVPRIELIKPDNYDALPVSGGEKQRIAIARCMFRDPKILLLDEATSALDKNVEEEIQKALDILMIGRTSIVVAHRLSTIVNCDKIFFLEAGVIKEFGNHKDLLEKKGRYYSLYNAGSGESK